MHCRVKSGKERCDRMMKEGSLNCPENWKREGERRRGRERGEGEKGRKEGERGGGGEHNVSILVKARQLTELEFESGPLESSSAALCFLPRIELTEQAAKGVGNEQSCERSSGNLQQEHLEGRAGR